MTKRITLTDDELFFVNKCLDAALVDGGDYALSGKMGKRVLRRFEKKLATKAPDSPQTNEVDGRSTPTLRGSKESSKASERTPNVSKASSNLQKGSK